MAKRAKSQIGAHEIVDLLACRHSADIFVPECKNGPSQCRTHLRLDAWAMLKSWSKPHTFGYEIKVSRSDFLGDDKWHLYLPYCSHFYFVVPAGLIEPSEVPENAGLIYVSATGSKLFTKRKAPWRNVEIPEDFYRYILMCRTRISREYDGPSKADVWRQWLEEKLEKRKLGYQVSRAIRDHVDKVQRENERLQEQMKEYDEVRSVLVRLGIDPNHRYGFRWSAEDRLREAMAKVPPSLMKAIERASTGLQSLLEEFKAEPVEQEALL
jgi:hypothetical protein